MAIEEINAAGGVLGKKIAARRRRRRVRLADLRGEGEEADPERQGRRASSAAGPLPAARRCCRSSKSNKALLYYPVQYEGLESSPYIFYTGATTNQQIVPERRVPAEGGQEEVLPPRLGLRLPAHGEQDHQGAARGLRRRDARRGVHARSATPTTRPLISKIKRAERRMSSTTRSTVTPTSPSSSSSRMPASPPTT